MSEDGDVGIGEHFVDTFYEAGQAIGALATGDLDAAQENFLDMSRDALDTISDGGYSHLIDRMNEDTGLDMRQEFTEGLNEVGGAIGEFVYDGVQAVGDAAEAVGEAAGDAAEWVGDTASDAYDAAADFVGDIFD
jgi:hypothetical protein